MTIRSIALGFLALISSAGVVAADMLPLKHGIYVPADRPCKGASNAEIVNYRGGKSAIGVAQAECTIRTLTRDGTVFTLHDECRDIQGGDLIEGGPTVLKISSPTAFEMSGTRYRYCGTKVEW